MRKFTAVLRRAGVQADQTLVTVESLHQIVAETTVPFSIFPTELGGPEIGRVTRVYVQDDVLHGDIELDGPCCEHSKADDWTCSEACYPCDPGCCPQGDEPSKTGSDEGLLLGGDATLMRTEPDATAESRPPASS